MVSAGIGKIVRGVLVFGDVARSISVFLPVAKFFRKLSLFRRDLMIYAHLYHRTRDSERRQVVVIDFGQAEFP
jgi:hypothetical protein